MTALDNARVTKIDHVNGVVTVDTVCARCFEHGVYDVRPNSVTRTWLEPLCDQHYADAARRQPRVELWYKDGHREMLNNFVYPKIYRHAPTTFNEATGEIEAVMGPDGKPFVAWFEYAGRHGTPSGKPILCYYREIDPPKAPEPPKAFVVDRVTLWQRVRAWF